jgi:hypothetical protein
LLNISTIEEYFYSSEHYVTYVSLILSYGCSLMTLSNLKDKRWEQLIEFVQVISEKWV